MKLPYRQPLPQVDGDNTWSKIGSVANSLAPFASNIVNAFRRAPMPPVPTRNAPVTLNRVNYQADRNDVNRAIRGANLGVDNSLAGNTGAAVKAVNLATGINSLSRINQAENNANTEIGNLQARINADIEQGNNARFDQYNRDLVEREIAMQNQSSANIANAADKYVALRNEREKRLLDDKRFGVLSRMYSPGVLDRMQKFYKDMGIDDPLNTKRMGGVIKGKVKAF